MFTFLSGVLCPASLCKHYFKKRKGILMILGSRGITVCDLSRFWASYMVIECLICIIHSESYEKSSDNIMNTLSEKR